MEKKIYFDMDGTIADLYGVENWLEYLINEQEALYINAKPLLNLQVLARQLNKLISQGWEINIISWLSKGGTISYNEKVINAKKRWLQKHLNSVKFTNIHIVEYGVSKCKVANYSTGILFDDEIQNRSEWWGIAYEPENIMEVLKAL